MQKERLPSPWDNRPTTLARPAALEKIEKRSSSGSRYGPHWPGRPAMSKPLRPRAATKPRRAALGWDTTERAWNAERPSGFKAVKTLRTPHQLGVHRSLTRPARRGAKNQRKKRKFSTIFKNFKRFLGNGSLRGRAETREGDSNCGGLFEKPNVSKHSQHVHQLAGGHIPFTPCVAPSRLSTNNTDFHVFP